MCAYHSWGPGRKKRPDRQTRQTDQTYWHWTLSASWEPLLTQNYNTAPFHSEESQGCPRSEANRVLPNFTMSHLSALLEMNFIPGAFYSLGCKSWKTQALEARLNSKRKIHCLLIKWHGPIKLTKWKWNVCLLIVSWFKEKQRFFVAIIVACFPPWEAGREREWHKISQNVFHLRNHACNIGVPHCNRSMKEEWILM